MLFPITSDESYYWVWTHHLDWSFVDHPPMIAWLDYLFTLGAPNLFTLRLGLNLLVLLVTFIIFGAAQKMFNERVAFFAALLFQLTPQFAILWLTMFVDVPLLLFWGAALLFSAALLKEDKFSNWLALAVAVGLGYLCKYSMLLFWPCFGLFCLKTQSRRHWLIRWEFYLSVAVSALFLLPVCYWNFQHNFASLAFHNQRLGIPLGLSGLNLMLGRMLEFMVMQLVHFSPFLWWFVFPASVVAFKSQDERWQFLLCLSWPVFILFLILSAFTQEWPHWPAVAYVGFIMLVAVFLVDKGRALIRLVWANVLLVLVVLLFLLLASPAILLHQSQYRANATLHQQVDPSLKVYCQINVSASLLEFYLNRPTYLTLGFLDRGKKWGEKMYAIWGQPKLARGENILYFGEDNQFTRQQLAAHFEWYKIDESFSPYFVEDYINCHRAFLAYGFKGGEQQP
jgi:4-amino-4-deoxy-L-arabinose transferase-like glycosyltransferase